MTHQSETCDEAQELPSPRDFCLSVPLYKSYPYDDDSGTEVWMLYNYSGVLDCHCHGCGTSSVFRRGERGDALPQGRLTDFLFALTFNCSRESSHTLTFMFHAHRGQLRKVGQWPSLADLATPGIRRYRSALGASSFGDFSRALGLASHGIGAGAFIYLRRVFERLIEEAKTRASESSEWSESSYVNARMDEKIRLLKEHLPKFLVDNRHVYGVMSTGVHSLDEDQCLSAFPIVRAAIELMLDERLEAIEREAKIQGVQNELQQLQQALKNPSDE